MNIMFSLPDKFARLSVLATRAISVFLFAFVLASCGSPDGGDTNDSPAQEIASNVDRQKVEEAYAKYWPDCEKHLADQSGENRRGGSREMHSCSRLMQELGKLGAADDAYDVFEKACGGDPYWAKLQCYSGEIMSSLNAEKIDQATRTQLVRTSRSKCSSDDMIACRNLGYYIGAYDKPAALDSWEKGCDLGDVVSCNARIIHYDYWENEPDVIESLEVVSTLLERNVFVAAGDVTILNFEVNDRRSRLRLHVLAQNPVPLDILFSSGKVSEVEYQTAAALQGVVDVANLLGGTRGKSVFDDEWAIEGMVIEFESPVRRLRKGTHSVILDNTQAFTPTRGDAVITVAVQVLE